VPGNTAKQILQSMDTSELELVQNAHRLADPIKPSEISDEGAINLLSQPDCSDAVDTNNDGIIEVGKAHMIMFPLPDSPEFVKQAWTDATEGMTEMEKMTLQLDMYISIYGIQIDETAEKKTVNPAQLWSNEEISELMESLRDKLDFQVAIQGWTEHNKLKQRFYDGFEASLKQHSSNMENAPSNEGFNA